MLLIQVALLIISEALEELGWLSISVWDLLGCLLIDYKSDEVSEIVTMID